MTRITVVESVAGKFGPQLKDNQGYLSFGKFYKGETQFVSGTQLDVDLFVTAKGNRYINSLSIIGQSIAPSNQGVNTEAGVPVKRGRKPFKSASEVVSSLPTSAKKEVNWDELGRGKTASLFVEALLGNPNVTQSLDVDIDAMEIIVWNLVDMVFKTRKQSV